jgi:hypothetical protein
MHAMVQSGKSLKADSSFALIKVDNRREVVAKCETVTNLYTVPRDQ